MNWIKVKDRLPTKSGKYIVSCLGNFKYQTKNKFETSYFYNDKTKEGSFDVHNQTVIYWLEE